MADPETMDKTEILILEVAKNPVLFDKAEKAYKETVKKKYLEGNWRKSWTDNYVIYTTVCINTEL